jgi:DNA-binding GntR family transcriptional regulator
VSLDEAIERSSLRGEAVRRIRAAIVYGEIAPGEIHSAPALAARMGVSVTPVREALLELTHRGMVSQVRNRGFRIVEHTAQELDAALELRALLEIPLLGRLAGRLEDPGHFERLVEAGLDAAARADEGAFLDLDRAFHLGLLAAAGNPRVVGVVDEVLDQLRLATFHNALEEVAAGHARILAALVAGDREATETAAREHLELTRTAWR